MAQASHTDEFLISRLEHAAQFQTITEAAQAIGLPRNTYDNQLRKAQVRFPDWSPHKRQFEVADLPTERKDTETLLAQRRETFKRISTARQARKLIPIKIKCDGPIGVVHFGDPHVDDDGTDIITLERDMKIVRETDGCFAANVGDLQNAWVGRLGKLYAHQETTAAEAWQLVEWLFRSVDWLYIIAGNHDLWSGDGDPCQWIARHTGQIYEAHGVRANLLFPNGKEVRINARHDFSGHSAFNPNHGPMKAAQYGWRDHILTAGHRHVSFVAGPLKDPSTGLLSWTIRCAGYKVWDEYASEKGLPDQNAFGACMTIIDPTKDDDDPNLITVLPCVEQGAEYLKFLRKRS